jgi:predicted nucleic acid-binding protein
MTVVVDASVAVKWYVRQPDSAAARLLSEAEESLIAPDMIMAEVANALWRHVKAGETSRSESLRAIASLPSLLSELVPARDLAVAALDLAHSLDCSPYDCLYAVLAVDRRCGFITADRKFAERLRSSKRLAKVKLLDDFAR